MKTFKYIVMATILLFNSCQTDEKSNKVYEEGVSLELAQLRKQEIKDLKYHLRFSILRKQVKNRGYGGIKNKNTTP